MADQDALTLGTITYWCREKHYRQMQTVATDAQRKYANDPVLKYFNALGMLLEGRTQESFRELDPLLNKQDVNLCSTLAMIHGHRKAKIVDKEAVQQLDNKLKTERKQGTAKAFYFAGLFHVLTEKYDKAREYIDRALKMNMEDKGKDLLALKGWLELMDDDDVNAKKSVKFFDESLGLEGIKSVDALFGKAKYLALQRSNFSGALDLINQSIVLYSNFLPGLIEKMKYHVALQDWEQAIDTAQRALAVNPHCLQAKRYMILHQLCKQGDYNEAASMLEDLMKAFNQQEPQNSFLLDNFAKIFCRVCGRNLQVLQQTYILQEKAVMFDETNPLYLNELGYELLMQNRPRDAIKCYSNALKLDENSLSTLTGLLSCQLLDNQLQEAANQLEFLNELKDNIGTSAELVYLGASLSLKRNESSEKIIKQLNKAIEMHFAGIKGLPLGTEYFLALNPNFLTQVVTDYLTFAPQQPLTKGQTASPVLQRCMQVLDPLYRAMPGLIEATFLMAKAKFLSGDVDGASGLLQHIIEQDPTISGCHILMAQIHLHSNNIKMANASLELGLSYNFQVRDHPVYHLIKARILKKQGDVQEAVKTLQTAMQLPGVKLSGKRPVSDKKGSIQITTNDRVSVYLELADGHRLLNQQHEAAKVMQDAINDFQGTGEEVRIAVSNVDLALARNDIEEALSMLRNIGPDQAYYVQAKEKMAEIYLNYRKDKRLYASCYRELSEKAPSAQTSILLGDAYMSILELDKAIEVYESAMKKNPRDMVLASKIGQALVKTHQFGKAVIYYESALKQSGQQSLRYDLAELLIRLKHTDKAEKIIKQFIEQDDKSTEFDNMVQMAKCLLLLSQICQHQSRYDERVSYLNKSKELQDRVLMRANVDQPDSVTNLKLFAAKICSELAQHHVQLREYDKAIQFYREAHLHNETNGKIMLELAKLLMITDDIDNCEQQCKTMISENREKESATVMMGEIMFKRNNYDQATACFEQLLGQKPDHYAGLARVVDILRCAGKLEECPKYLEMAEKSSRRAEYEAGFNYCKGLYEWYTGNTNKALKYFNLARKDFEYGTPATYNMIEICLNPDNETLGGEVFESGDIEPGEAKEKKETEAVGLKTAERLLKELKPKPGDNRHIILTSMLMIATKNRGNIESALATLMEINKAEDNVSALFGTAVAFMVLKQSQKARSQLKRVARTAWNLEDAEDLEKSWLLLADMYIQKENYDTATELLNRVLSYNKSSGKACEYLGYIMEKQHAYKEAAQFYEQTWKYGNKNNPAIGYKLAFNYLKSKRLTDAIDVCHQVLAAHSKYPKIKKEILDKARSQIKVG